MGKLPTAAPETYTVQPLSSPADIAPKRGRRPKPVMPNVPQECLDGFQPLERQWFDYFIEQTCYEYPDLTPLDKVFLTLAGLELINLLRTMAEQLKSGQIISMARQHPAVQFRAWIDMLSISRKQRKPAGDAKDKELADKWLSAFAANG